MPNAKEIKIVYSLRVHLKLQQMGFKYVSEMKNPRNDKLNCWVYEVTPAFLEAFDLILKEGCRI